ncbi:MAG: hypothetical protein Q4C01_07335 [Clostridia bacterium]|nr:hypothetical protein [Clostridia bacterium]
MESNLYFTNDDRFGRLLKENAPLPSEAFNRRIADTLLEIRTPAPSRIRSFALKKPLAFVAIMALILALCVGTAFAAVELFRNVFGNAETQIEEKIGTAQEQYPELKEGMEGMAPEDAAALDAKLDFEATSDASMRAIMQAVSCNAVIVGQESAGIILSEFSVYDAEGVELVLARHLYFGLAMPIEMSFEKSATVCIDGYEVLAIRSEMPLKSSQTEQYALFECIPNRSAQGLPVQSLITLEMGGAAFCFRYDWSEKSVAVPQSDEELLSWLSEAEGLKVSVLEAGCVYPSGSVTKDGFTVQLCELAIDGNVLRLSAEISADGDKIGMRALVNDIAITIRGYEYRIGVELFVVRLLPDDFDFSTGTTQRISYELTLPYHANELKGEELLFGFTLKARAQAAEWQPQYDYTETPFEFVIKIA